MGARRHGLRPADPAARATGSSRRQPLPWQLRVEERIEPALEGADVVMALRMQRERQHAGLIPSLREYCRLYGLTTERLALAQPGALVMHPGPMNEGVEIAPEVAHGAQSVIEEQVTNGVAVRMALLYLLSGGTARLDGDDWHGHRTNAADRRAARRPLAGHRRAGGRRRG